MTAEMAGKAVVDGIWGTFRKVKDQWVLLAFLTVALFWARDAYNEFAGLPELMRRQMEGLATLEGTVRRLEAELMRRLDGDHAPVFGFPGTRHSIDDGAPGAWTVLRWSPVRRLRTDCTPNRIDAFMIDQGGRWFSVETAMAPMPVLEGNAELAFSMRIHPRMDRDRARASVQITSDCGSHLHVEATPWLPCRMLDG